ncbi:MAG: hypothetical protein JXQ73_29060 [Phycisphaerae bacterium]|nr:hypothetical protein [Phycisphaerae bacterium]
MDEPNRRDHITRRTALRRIGAASAAGAGLTILSRPRSARAATRAKWNAPKGVEVWQLTDKSYSQANIYCEHSYCSADSRRFVYERRNEAKKDGPNPAEYVVMELGTWKQERLDEGLARTGVAISRDGVFYYLKRFAPGDGLWLMRANLSDGKPRKVHRLEAPLWSIATVSSDHRYYACGRMLDGEIQDGKQVFGVCLIDLKTGQERILTRGTDIMNPHPQVAPDGKSLLIQHNRGGKVLPGGKYESLVGPEGATLFLLSLDGKRTPLQIGKPYTTPISGHETWIDPTREILASVAALDEYAPDKGNLVALRQGSAPRRVTKGYNFNHVHASRCGRVFLADDWKPPYRQVLGSIKTGKSCVLLDMYDSQRQMSKPAHAHTYLTRDLKWAIFNSDRTGPILLYAARVPGELIDDVLKA